MIEVQHGIISNSESGYTWSRGYNSCKGRIVPLPDKIIVFGDLWKQQILRNGYWLPKNIIISTNIVIKHYRNKLRKLKNNINILLVSQDYTRNENIRIIEDF